MRYRDALAAAMTALAEDPRTVFLGQAVAYPGTYMSATFAGVPRDRLIELPVAEELQLGMSIGMALAGLRPISVFPRWNFLLLAANQFVNHMDKMYVPVIVRVGIGSERPLHPGDQHVGDFSGAFASMCKHTTFISLREPDEIVPAYLNALQHEGPTVLTEQADLYIDR